MLSGQGKTLWCTQSRREVMGVQTAVESSICFSIVCAQNTAQALLLYLWNTKFFLQENVKICTLFSHFASVYWLCPWTQLRDFCPPDALAPPILDNSWSTSCEIPPLRSPGTPAGLWCNQSQSPSPQGSWLWLPRHTGVMWGHPMLDIARHVICTK